MRFFLSAVLLVALSSTAFGATVLTFEGLGNLEPVQGFYNGGAGGFGSIGPNLGVEFNADALAIIDADAGGSGNIGGEPSPSTVLFFLTGTAILNYAAGFDTGFAFFYSAVNNPGSINVYDGLNATGNLLATLALPVTASDGGDPTGSFSPFFAIGVGFAGTAKSIDFGGTTNQIAFDNITFGALRPGGEVPEPSTWMMLGAGLGAVGLLRRRK